MTSSMSLAASSGFFIDQLIDFIREAMEYIWGFSHLRFVYIITIKRIIL